MTEFVKYEVILRWLRHWAFAFPVHELKYIYKTSITTHCLYIFIPNSVGYIFSYKLSTSGKLETDPNCLKIKSYWPKKLI